MAAAGALEYPKTNYRNGKKEKLYFIKCFPVVGSGQGLVDIYPGIFIINSDNDKGCCDKQCTSY